MTLASMMPRLSTCLTVAAGCLLSLGDLPPVRAGDFAGKWSIAWTDHPGNPIDLKSPGARAYKPYVLYSTDWPAESRYRVWYDSASIAGLAYGFSADGLTWSTGAPLTGIQDAAASATGGEFAGRPVVLYNKAWAKPFRLYYYGRTDTAAHKIWVAESSDGIAFTGNQVALDPELEGSRMGTFPDGHAVVHLPGRNATPEDPDAARPFLMYFRSRDGQGIAMAESKDGFTFTEIADNPDTAEVVEGMIQISGIPDGGTVLPAQPTQVLQLAQNDLRMFAFEQNTTLKYLVSANGVQWTLVEDPIATIGSVGEAGTWNDQRNYYASAAYLGGGRFYLLRGGRDNTTGVYASGAAFGTSAFYTANDLERWQTFSPMNNWQTEGWVPFTTSGNDPDGTVVAVVQNADGTTSIRDRKESGNFYLRHDASWVVPFTFEFRARIDDIVGTGADEEFPKFTVAAFQTDPDQPGGEAWQPAFASQRFGRWALNDASLETAIHDFNFTGFQTFTVVCRFDESARARLALNPADGAANVALCVYEVYLNRDFSAPKAVYFNTGFMGWDTVDYDGALDIGFPGPTSGQVTVDWVRWGNGVILDPTAPDAPATSPTLSLSRQGTGLRIAWTPAGGTLQGAASAAGPWADETGVANGSTIAAPTGNRFFRVRM
jgi:hypothetical protein